MKQRRAFDRSEFIGFRCPREYKARLAELARKRVRDLSSLVLEFVAQGVERMEQEERRRQSQPH